jgi:hypothetical protein
LWFLNRLAAAIICCVAVGYAVSAVNLFIWDLAQGENGFKDFLFYLIYDGMLFTIVGTALGIVPVILVLCLSNAKYRPWHSIPALLLGASSASVPADYFVVHNWTHYNALVNLLLIAAAPMAGGIITSHFIPKPLVR